MSAMPRQTADRAQISATVPASVKAQVARRADDEDRLESAVVTRALLVYLAMPMDDAERAVREARGATPVVSE